MKTVFELMAAFFVVIGFIPALIIWILSVVFTKLHIMTIDQIGFNRCN